MKPQTVLLLSATLIAGLLFAGLFCAHAQAVRLPVEETLCETLKEGGLTEESQHFTGCFFVTDPRDLCADRKFGLYVDSSARCLAGGFHDWIMPLRI